MSLEEVLKKLGIDDWILQQTGIIDHGKRVNLPGTQPVRAVIHITFHYFQQTHREFFDHLCKLVTDGKLNRELDLQYGEVPIEISTGGYRTPKIVNATRTIQLHETFLSFQWCITYAIYTLYVEQIDFPRVNAEQGAAVKKITPENIEKAKEVFEYARFIVKMFAPWNKDNMPNPERYNAAQRDYIEQTNLLFTEGIKFILIHEVIHAQKHLDNLPDEDCPSCFQEIEYEADNGAIDHILQGAGDAKFLTEIGITLGILSMIFFRSTTVGKKHPNVEDRITNALNRMKADNNSVAWAFACVGLEFWDEQFDLNFDWKDKGHVSYNELYFGIVNQLKAKRQ